MKHAMFFKKIGTDGKMRKKFTKTLCTYEEDQCEERAYLPVYTQFERSRTKVLFVKNSAEYLMSLFI
jgi:hypothetical protein